MKSGKGGSHCVAAMLVVQMVYAAADIVPARDIGLLDKFERYVLTNLKPLFDYPIRDTSICLGPDGIYYMTGTTGAPDMWAVTGEIRVWKSPDLINWEPVVTKPRTRSVVWSIDRDGTWEKKISIRDGAPFRPLWAPEIHYLKNTFWITYSIPWLGNGILKSVTGKAEGPYVCINPHGPISNDIDASLFEDDDGTIYFVCGNGKIRRMKDDMSGPAEIQHAISASDGKRIGFEGAFLFKANGKYHLTAANFVDGSYHCYSASADSVYGPYGDRYLAVPHGGHNVFFRDKQGNWWSTFFGNDKKCPFRERPAILRVEFDSQNRIQPVINESKP